MGDAADRPANGDALWRFSLAFYAHPGVAQALIALQDRDALDVNLTLFALWFGISGRGRLSKDALAEADRAISTIRTDIVEPLRALRRRLRHDPDADVQRLRGGVKELELAAEKLVQTRLARLPRSFGVGSSPGARLATAHANLALYLGPERVRATEAVIIQEALEAFAQDL